MRYFVDCQKLKIRGLFNKLPQVLIHTQAQIFVVTFRYHHCCAKRFTCFKYACFNNYRYTTCIYKLQNLIL